MLKIRHLIIGKKAFKYNPVKWLPSVHGHGRRLLSLDTALETLSESVVEHFVENLKMLSPGINCLELLRYTRSDWRKRGCFAETKS